MIRINLLGKKKAAAVPFALDERLEKLGINVNELGELRSGLIRAAVMIAGLYVADYVPTYFHDIKAAELDEKSTKLAMQSAELQKELNSKRDIRKQMEQLSKEEVELQRQLNAVNALQRGRTAAFDTLNDVSAQLSKFPTIWIEDLKLENRKVTMNGRAWEWYPINDFVKEITESTRYANVLFKEVVSEDSKALIAGVPESVQKTKRFALEFNVKEAGE